MPCSLVQLARVVVVRVILVDVVCVMFLLIRRHTVSAVLVAIFVVIFCNWRCTLYTMCPVGVAEFGPDVWNEVTNERLREEQIVGCNPVGLDLHATWYGQIWPAPRELVFFNVLGHDPKSGQYHIGQMEIGQTWHNNLAKRVAAVAAKQNAT